MKIVVSKKTIGFGGVATGTAGDDMFDIKRGDFGIDLSDGGADQLRFDNRNAGTKTVTDFTVGEDTMFFRLDGGYFAGHEIGTRNKNQAKVETADDVLELIEAVLADDGSENAATVEGDDLVLRIDADNHFRGDLILDLDGVAKQLDLSDIFAGTDADDSYRPGRGTQIVATGDGLDTVQIDNRNAGTKIFTDWDIKQRATESDWDTLVFRLDGKYFEGSAISGNNANQARVETAADFVEFLELVEAKGGENDVAIDGNDVTVVIDADNHFRGDLTLVFRGVVDELETVAGFDAGAFGDAIA